MRGKASPYEHWGSKEERRGKDCADPSALCRFAEILLRISYYTDGVMHALRVR